MYANGMRFASGLVLILTLAFSSGSAVNGRATVPPATTPAATASAIAAVPPPGSQRLSGGCGATEVYKGGQLPDWANVNAPHSLPYVVATPGIAVGYLFTFPLAAGLEANTKVLWYVATPRSGSPLKAEGHVLGATQPVATFSKAADSFPGEIYPTGPTVPTPGCWLFTLTWLDGQQRADVDLFFH